VLLGATVVVYEVCVRHCTAAGGVSTWWRSGGTDALGGGETPTDAGLRLVSGGLGQAFELEGGCQSVQDDLGSRLHVGGDGGKLRSEEHTSELQSRENLVCRLLREKKNQSRVYMLV